MTGYFALTIPGTIPELPGVPGSAKRRRFIRGCDIIRIGIHDVVVVLTSAARVCSGNFASASSHRVGHPEFVESAKVGAYAGESTRTAPRAAIATFHKYAFAPATRKKHSLSS